MRASGLAIAVSLFSTGPSAAAQTEPATAIWEQGFHDSQCTITTGSPETLGISFQMTPGQPEPKLYLIGSSRKLPNYRGKVIFELAPKRDTFEVEVYSISSGRARVLQVGDLKHEFALAFARSDELSVVDGKRRTNIPIRGASKAFAALQGCITDTLPKWGVDSAAFAALKRPPTEIDGTFWISGADYPSDALRADWQGYLVVRLNVDATGDVTDCAVVVSSGWKSVDSLTCKKAITRGRFNPAIGADGLPTSAIRTRNVVFRLEN